MAEQEPQQFGRFIPLLGLGTEHPPPKPLVLVCHDGITGFFQNKAQGMEPSPQLTHPSPRPNQPCEADPDEQRSQVNGGTVHGPVLRGRGDSGGTQRTEPTSDHHSALVRASLPSPGDILAIRQFQADRERWRQRKQRQLERLAVRKAGRSTAAGRVASAGQAMQAGDQAAAPASASGLLSHTPSGVDNDVLRTAEGVTGPDCGKKRRDTVA